MLGRICFGLRLWWKWRVWLFTSEKGSLKNISIGYWIQLFGDRLIWWLSIVFGWAGQLLANKDRQWQLVSILNLCFCSVWEYLSLQPGNHNLWLSSIGYRTGKDIWFWLKASHYLALQTRILWKWNNARPLYQNIDHKIQAMPTSCQSDSSVQQSIAWEVRCWRLKMSGSWFWVYRHWHRTQSLRWYRWFR